MLVDGNVRNNFGNWFVQNVSVEPNITGFDFYAKKDLEMAKKADIGFMIWNGKSRGTFNNIVNLLKMNKEVVLYYDVTNELYYLKNLNDLNIFLNDNVKLNSKLKAIMPKIDSNKFIQVGLF